MACLRFGMEEEGYELIRALLPGGRDPRFTAWNPYVLSADVYSHPQHKGGADGAGIPGRQAGIIRQQWKSFSGCASGAAC
jgi:hypothetical protein